MKLGKVIGRVVSTRKLECFEGQKLLLVQQIDETGKDVGSPFVALDIVQAGEGDTIYWEGGREAGEALGIIMNPADAAVFAIVDDVQVGSNT